MDIIILNRNKDLDLLDDNVDVEVILDNGDRYSATFFTLQNIKSLMMRYQKTGECYSGLYFWASDMIIVEELHPDIINKTIQDLIKSNEFFTCFAKLI